MHGRPAKTLARERLAARWMDIAFLCRFGHQDVYRLLGRDPMTRPLTMWERSVFTRCIQEHWEAENKARDDVPRG